MGIDIKDYISEAIDNQTFFEEHIKGTYDDKGEGQSLFTFFHHIDNKMKNQGFIFQECSNRLSNACRYIDHDNPARQLIDSAIELLSIGMRGGK